MRERDDRNLPAEPVVWPAVTAVVPARNEADVIAQSIGSLLAQDYPGEFRIVLVDDNSEDGTGDTARSLEGAGARLSVINGRVRIRDGRFTDLALEPLLARHRELARTLYERARHPHVN